MEGDLPALRTVNLTVTGRCNRRCHHCYQERRVDDLATGRLIRLVDEISALGAGMLMIPGGEPLLRPDLEDVIRHASSRSIRTYVATNGSLVTEARARRLKESGLTGCCVGIDVVDPRSPEARHGAALPSALTAVRRLADAGVDVLANVVVTRHNMRHLRRFLVLLADHGARKVTILRPKPSRSPGWFEDSRLLRRDMFRLQLLKTRLETDLDLQFINLDCAFGPLLGGVPAEFLLKRQVEMCLAGRHYLCIDSNGDVYPCAHLKHPEFLAGNVCASSLGRIWASSPVFEAWRRSRLTGHCGDCQLARACGGCRALAYHDHGDPMAQDEDCPWGTATAPRAAVMRFIFWSGLAWRWLRTTRRAGTRSMAPDRSAPRSSAS